MKDDEVTWVLRKEDILSLLGILVSKKRQWLTQKIVSHNKRSKLSLTNLMYFSREWDKYQNITHLTLYLNLYVQGRIQEQAIKCILLQRLRMKVLGGEYHKN